MFSINSDLFVWFNKIDLSLQSCSKKDCPLDSTEDQILEELITEGIVNTASQINEEKILNKKLPALNKIEKARLSEVLNSKCWIQFRKYEGEPDSILDSIMSEIPEIVVNFLYEKYQSLPQVTIVGGTAFDIFKASYCARSIKLLGSKSFTKIETPEIQAEFSKKSPDVDERIILKGINESDFEEIQKRIIRVFQYRFCLKYGVPFSNKTYQFVKDRAFANLKIVNMDSNKFLIVSVEGGVKRDILVISELARSYLFSRDAICIPLTNDKNIYPYGDLSGGWQAIISRVTKTIIVPNPESVNAFGWPMLISYLSRSYTLMERETNKNENTEEILRNTLFQYLESNSDRDSILNVITKVLNNHFPMDKTISLFYLLNAFIFLKKTLANDELKAISLALLNDLQSTSQIILLLKKLLTESNIPFEIIEALLVVVGNMRMMKKYDPTSPLEFVFRRYCGGIGLQMRIKDEGNLRTVMLPNNLESSLKIINTYWLNNDSNDDAAKLLEFCNAIQEYLYINPEECPRSIFFSKFFYEALLSLFNCKNNDQVRSWFNVNLEIINPKPLTKDPKRPNISTKKTKPKTTSTSTPKPAAKTTPNTTNTTNRTNRTKGKTKNKTALTPKSTSKGTQNSTNVAKTEETEATLIALVDDYIERKDWKLAYETLKTYYINSKKDSNSYRKLPLQKMIDSMFEDDSSDLFFLLLKVEVINNLSILFSDCIDEFLTADCVRKIIHIMKINDKALFTDLNFNYLQLFNFLLKRIDAFSLSDKKELPLLDLLNMVNHLIVLSFSCAKNKKSASMVKLLIENVEPLLESVKENFEIAEISALILDIAHLMYSKGYMPKNLTSFQIILSQAIEKILIDENLDCYKKIQQLIQFFYFKEKFVSEEPDLSLFNSFKKIIENSKYQDLKLRSSLLETYLSFFSLKIECDVFFVKKLFDAFVSHKYIEGVIRVFNILKCLKQTENIHEYSLHVLKYLVDSSTPQQSILTIVDYLSKNNALSANIEFKCALQKYLQKGISSLNSKKNTPQKNDEITATDAISSIPKAKTGPVLKESCKQNDKVDAPKNTEILFSIFKVMRMQFTFDHILWSHFLSLSVLERDETFLIEVFNSYLFYEEMFVNNQNNTVNSTFAIREQCWNLLLGILKKLSQEKCEEQISSFLNFIKMQSFLDHIHWKQFLSVAHISNNQTFLSDILNVYLYYEECYVNNKNNKVNSNSEIREECWRSLLKILKKLNKEMVLIILKGYRSIKQITSNFLLSPSLYAFKSHLISSCYIYSIEKKIFFETLNLIVDVINSDDELKFQSNLKITQPSIVAFLVKDLLSYNTGFTNSTAITMFCQYFDNPSKKEYSVLDFRFISEVLLSIEDESHFAKEDYVKLMRKCIELKNTINDPLFDIYFLYFRLKNCSIDEFNKEAANLIKHDSKLIVDSLCNSISLGFSCYESDENKRIRYIVSSKEKIKALISELYKNCSFKECAYLLKAVKDTNYVDKNFIEELIYELLDYFCFNKGLSAEQFLDIHVDNFKDLFEDTTKIEKLLKNGMYIKKLVSLIANDVITEENCRVDLFSHYFNKILMMIKPSFECKSMRCGINIQEILKTMSDIEFQTFEIVSYRIVEKILRIIGDSSNINCYPAISFASELMISVLNTTTQVLNSDWNVLVKKFIYAPINLANDAIFLVFLRKVNLILISTYFTKNFCKLDVFLNMQLLIAPNLKEFKNNKDSVRKKVKEFENAVKENTLFLAKSKSYFPFKYAFIHYLSWINYFPEFNKNTSLNKELLDSLLKNLTLNPFISYESGKEVLELFNKEHIKPYANCFGLPLLRKLIETTNLDVNEHKLNTAIQTLDTNLTSMCIGMSPFLTTVYLAFIDTLIKIHQDAKDVIQDEKNENMNLLKTAIEKFIFLGFHAPKNESKTVSKESLKIFNQSYFKLYKNLSSLVLKECLEKKYYLNLKLIKPMQDSLSLFFSKDLFEIISMRWYSDLLKLNVFSVEFFEYARDRYEKERDLTFINLIDEMLENLEKYVGKISDLEKNADLEKLNEIVAKWASFRINLELQNV